MRRRVRSCPTLRLVEMVQRDFPGRFQHARNQFGVDPAEKRYSGMPRAVQRHDDHPRALAVRAHDRALFPVVELRCGLRDRHVIEDAVDDGGAAQFGDRQHPRFRAERFRRRGHAGFPCAGRLVARAQMVEDDSFAQPAKPFVMLHRVEQHRVVRREERQVLVLRSRFQEGVFRNWRQGVAPRSGADTAADGGVFAVMCSDEAGMPARSRRFSNSA